MAADRTLWDRLTRAAVIAGAAYMGAAQIIYYLSRVAYPDVLRARFPQLTEQQLLEADLLSTAVLVILSAMIGTFLSERSKLIGLGTLSDLKAALWAAFTLGPLLSVAIYVSAGRLLAEQLPLSYPIALPWAVAMALKGAVFDEVVGRFGMMTILLGLFRQPALATVLQAAFFTVVSAKALAFGGALSTELIVLSLLGAFVLHAGAGYFYVRYGLLSAMLFHLLVDLRFVFHALLGGLFR